MKYHNAIRSYLCGGPYLPTEQLPTNQSFIPGHDLLLNTAYPAIFRASSSSFFYHLHPPPIVVIMPAQNRDKRMSVYKIVVIGDGGVGKTCLTTQFILQYFVEEVSSPSPTPCFAATRGKRSQGCSLLKGLRLT
jgi:hypothetical protein